MPFVAKKRGPYAWGSTEWLNNVRMINGFLNQFQITLEAQAGIIGNIHAESGMNPWRWGGDSSDPTHAYGLFQYWPGSGYTNSSVAQSYLGYGPSLSTTGETPGETPDDGWAQMLTLVNNALGKWYPAMWRNGWDREQYSQEYNEYLSIVNTWAGDDSRLSFPEYCDINNAFDAGCAFFAAYEGAAVRGMFGRGDNAVNVLHYLSADVPPEPPGTVPGESKSKWIYYLRPLWWQSINRRK